MEDVRQKLAEVRRQLKADGEGMKPGGTPPAAARPQPAQAWTAPAKQMVTRQLEAARDADYQAREDADRRSALLSVETAHDMTLQRLLLALAGLHAAIAYSDSGS